MKYEEFAELAKTRKSIRNFKEEKVSDGNIMKMLDVARWAPSDLNTPPWDSMIPNDEESIQKPADAIKINTCALAPR